MKKISFEMKKKAQDAEFGLLLSSNDSCASSIIKTKKRVICEPCASVTKL